jgi:hypothetical protein
MDSDTLLATSNHPAYKYSYGVSDFVAPGINERNGLVYICRDRGGDMSGKLTTFLGATIGTWKVTRERGAITHVAVRVFVGGCGQGRTYYGRLDLNNDQECYVRRYAVELREIVRRAKMTLAERHASWSDIGDAL